MKRKYFLYLTTSLIMFFLILICIVLFLKLLMKLSTPRYGIGIVTQVSYDCDIQFKRCYVVVKNVGDQPPNQTIVFGDAYGIDICNRWIAVPKDMKVGDTVEYYARPGVFYSEYTPKNILSVCSDYSKNIFPSTLFDTNAYYIRKK
ncbi:hypothetical protein A2160_01480 [Candidatus Beckwithbacteria bacterium RBG_13_42_9]|uniref:Uncharacterized protein n=1 Tax=Candidatus Beckwithbacteria bacterium RBG_13_42_9 TaxID=1797457 RepID=A0A1F5E9D0_9BACT|nr:MAG: hypothetical protein A2160_01480 [Candidatus Beckwithbacteria bacterium RBG_13_42_9]